MIVPRYTQPPIPPHPVLDRLSWTASKPGRSFDIKRATEDIREALLSLDQREVTLSLVQEPAPPPDPQELQLFLQTIIDRASFDGLVEIYLSNLQSGEKLHFAYRAGEYLPVDIAFTAASTIKIPIMVSSYRRLSAPISENTKTLLALMISESKKRSFRQAHGNSARSNTRTAPCNGGYAKARAEKHFPSRIFLHGRTVIRTLSDTR